MIITCPNCRTRYMVSAQAIGVTGRKVRCAACKHTWFQEAELLEAEPLVPEEAFNAPEKGPFKEGRAEEGPMKEGSGQARKNPMTAVVDFTPSKETGARNKEDAEFVGSEQGGVQAPQMPQMPIGALAGRNDPKALRQKKASEKKKGTAVGFPRGKQRRMARWFYITLILVLFGTLIGLNLVFWRDKIVTLVPEARELYTHLGLMDAPGRLMAGPIVGLTINPPRTGERFERNGQTIQLVMGTITNPTGKDLPVPPLKGILRDRAGKIVYEWTFRAPIEKLASGQSVAFESEIIGLPETAQSMLIEFDTSR